MFVTALVINVIARCSMSDRWMFDCQYMLNNGCRSFEVIFSINLCLDFTNELLELQRDLLQIGSIYM